LAVEAESRSQKQDTGILRRSLKDLVDERSDRVRENDLVKKSGQDGLHCHEQIFSEY
jgi:hypothetical protein